MAEFAWSKVEVVGDPRLLIGRRPRPHQLSGVRIDLHQDTFGVLAEIARTALDGLASSQARPYEPFAALEDGEEHFELRVDQVQGVGGDSAHLFGLLDIVDDLEVEDPRELSDRSNAFYALCWPDAPTPLSVIKKIDPARAVRHGRFFQYRDTLRRMENPDLILADSVDFAIAGDRAGVLRSAPFRQLLSDTQVALEQVPTYVESISESLEPQVPMSNDSRTVLTAKATARVSYAQRLGRLVDRLQRVAPTRAQIEQACQRHLGDPHALLDDKGRLEITESTVPLALDLLEGRLFEDDFSGEHRRADRWSRTR